MMATTTISSKTSTSTGASKTATTRNHAASRRRTFVPNLSQLELEELREAFDLFDTDGKGIISGKELREVLLSLQQQPNESSPTSSSSISSTTNNTSKFRNIQLLLEKLEWQDVELNFEEFVQVLTTNDDDESATAATTGEDHDDDDDDDAGIRRVFRLFDNDKKGYISMDDLKQVAEGLGETMEENELQEMMDRASIHGSGKIGYEEFRNVMTTKLFFAESGNQQQKS